MDVHRDQQGTSCAIIVLAIFGALGLAYSLLATGSFLTEGAAWPLGILLVVLAALAAISAVRVYSRPRPPTGPRGIGRVVLNTLALTGALFGGLILLAIAAVIVLLVACMSGAVRLGPFH